MKSILTSIITIAIALIDGASAAPQISAQLQPQEIGLGEAARLLVTISGDSRTNDRPTLPEVDGLSFQPAGQSSQIRIVNGQASSTIGFTYRVSADRAGEFAIPPITANAGGQKLQTDTLKLRVHATSNVTPKSLQNPGSTTAPSVDSTDSSGLAFLRIDRADNGERDHLYVGELTPIAIRAFFREGVQVSQITRPALAGGSFTLHQLSEEPEQESTVVDGKRYRMLTWYAGLSGAKASDEKLQATLQATVGIPQKRDAQQPAQRRIGSPLGGSLFDDPFFDRAFDDFFQRVEQREITLGSEEVALAIKPLPAEGRPQGFDGAVGEFKLGSFSIPTELQTGNPVELQATITGKGNFDRVTAPQILPEGKWKTYDAKQSLEPGDKIGWQGAKKFTLPAIALDPGELQVGFQFSYFDPNSGNYQTIRSQEMPVTITGKPFSPAEPAVSDSESPAAKVADALAPLRGEPVRYLADPSPLYTHPWFIALQGISALTLISALAVGSVRRRNDDPVAARHRATETAIATQLHDLSIAQQRQDGLAFFTAARRAIQHRLAERWHCNPETITGGEISQRLAGSSAAARVFAMADAIEFSGARPDPDAFDEWAQRTRTALEEIDQPAEDRSGRQDRTWGEAPQAI